MTSMTLFRPVADFDAVVKLRLTEEIRSAPMSLLGGANSTRVEIPPVPAGIIRLMSSTHLSSGVLV